MIPLARLAAAALLALGTMAAAPADSPVDVPEPEGLHTGPQQGYTPPTLKGAAVLDIDGLDRVVAQGKPVLLDVALADRRPAGMAADKPWLPAHRSIPGAVWMPSAGGAPLDPAHEALFLRRVAELTEGDKARAIVTFCHPDCWGSWNAGKRLVQAGYTGVHWFPTGLEGWQERHETAVVKEDPAWAGRAAAGAQR
ncbi:MAG: rhodanese-like domain-containing protein [Methylobacterium sp.]|uniref:rhodanese-like domain-containing protein n=1 Tax=Methylobacterium sp. TaxID=409 RepID=UPI00271CAAE7|nr:rhodanese-like domain-containing protein [Methylobacterium sp.]MDO9428849.1 rhodanese-like domain-containing protein [Methylobacterium sp.]